MTDESWNKSPTDDTAKARAYASSPFGIRPVEYGAFLDGRLSLRKELNEASERVSAAEDILRRVAEYGPPQGEKHDGIACAFCDMGGAGYSTRGDGFHDDQCAVKDAQLFEARQASQASGTPEVAAGGNGPGQVTPGSGSNPHEVRQDQLGSSPSPAASTPVQDSHACTGALCLVCKAKRESAQGVDDE